MASRGSALSRSVRFFREGELDEVRVAFQLVKEIVERRLAEAKQGAPAKTRKPRKSRQADAGVTTHAAGESLASA
jgi:hypothetical protein